jgi:UDP-glucuronate 4-epimerase
MNEIEIKQVLVTGCAGFIASRVCELLLRENVVVVGIDNMNDYYDVRLKDFRIACLKEHKNFIFLKGDVENKETLEKLFAKYKFDSIYHLAARAGVRYSMDYPEVYYSTNVLGTLNLLNLMKQFSVKKIVLASTSSIYAGQKMPFLESLAVNEPISPYAATKKAAELLCYSYHFLYGLDVSIVRYFTVYGPSGRPDMSIFRFIRWIDEGKEIELFGDGTQSRDFTFVDDIAKGTIAAGKALLGYEIINLGGGKNPIALTTVISSLETILGKKAKIKNFDFHKADLKETWADIGKAKMLLGWEPEIGFQEGLIKTVESYYQHQVMKEINL